MRRTLLYSSAVWAVLLLSVTAGWAQVQAEQYLGRDVVANEAIVQLGQQPALVLSSIVSQQNISGVKGIGRSGLLLIHSNSKSVADLVGGLNSTPGVSRVEPNYIIHAVDVIPNDTDFNLLWGLRNTGQTILGDVGTPGADIGASQAWSVTVGSRSNVVGVVDTGVDYLHPDLRGNIWSAPAPFTVSLGGVAVNCPAGSHGFNAILMTCDPMDDNNHGSHVSGTIGATGNNASGVAGINWIASIMGLKFLDDTGTGSSADAMNAIDFAIQTKLIFGGSANIRVLNSSWGGDGFSQMMLDEINLAGSNDMLFVAAAGNNGTNNDIMPFYPADYNAANLIAVAATTNTDAKAGFSNYGPTTVNLGAPGNNILSTVCNPSGGACTHAYAYFSGTSMAAPHVTGSAALILSACNLTTVNLRSTILSTVDPIASMSGITTTGGRLNVNNAIQSCAGVLPDFSLYASPPSRTIVVGASTTYAINVTPVAGFSGAVTLSIAGLPTGAFSSFSPASVAAGSNSTLNIVTTGAVASGIYSLTLMGTSGALVHSIPVNLIVTDFSLTASPASRTIAPGGATSYTTTVSAIGGFTGAVAFNVTGLPSGAFPTFTPGTVTGAGTTTMGITTASTVATGSYPLVITGTSGELTHTASVTLVINSTPDFSLSAAPATQTIIPGGSTSYTTTVAVMGGFSGTVSFNVSGLPTGATPTFTPSTVTGAGSTTLGITTTAAVSAGSYPLTITGTSGTLTHTASVTLVINSTSNFGMSANPASRTIPQGGSTSYTAVVTTTGGFSGTVTFGVNGLPAGATATFSPATVIGAGSTTATIATTTAVAPGSYPLVIKGISGTVGHGSTVTLVVTGSSDFSLSSTPATQTIVQGGSTSFTNTVSTSGGFSGTVAFGVTGLPTGATPTFTPPTVTGAGSTTLGITTTVGVAPGSYPLTITGTSGTLTHNASVTLVINVPPNFSVSATPSTQTIIQGGLTSYNTTVTATGGFAGTVSFSVSGLPAGAMPTFTPSTVTGAGSTTLGITTTAAVATGSYPVVITGTSGVLTQTASVTLVINSAPDFSLSATPATQTIIPGGSTSYTTTVAIMGGFSGTVSFSVSGLPAGATPTFTPSTVTGAGSTTLGITTTAAVSAGNYPLTITGTSGTLTRTASGTLVVNSAANFGMSANPGLRTIPQGGSTSYTAVVTTTGGFSGTVSFGVNGLPAGAAATFTPATVIGAGSTTVTITTTAAVAPGSYPLVIRGISGTVGRGSTVTLVVTGSSDFSLSSTPATQTIVQGGSTSFSNTVSISGGFSGTVTFSVTGLPTGATPTFASGTVTGAVTTSMGITTTAAVATGNRFS